jgi:hypothetical protein
MGSWRHLLVVAWLSSGAAATTHAQSQLSLTIVNGKVTLVAQDVSLRAILDEWTRVTGMTIVNGDRLDLTPVTLRLTDVAEPAAVATLLRDVSGYMVALRADGTAIDRIFIAQTAPSRTDRLATVTSDTTSAAPMPAFTGSTFSDPTFSEPTFGAPPAAPPYPSGPATSSAAKIETGRGTPTTEPADATGLVDGARAETVVPPEQRPPTPLLPSGPSGPANPFGTVTGSATPGVITAPPPGITIPKPTLPPEEGSQSTAKPR